MYIHVLHYSHESCSAALCSDPDEIDNGMVTFTGNSIGDMATYTCNSGFGLIRANTTRCIKMPDMNFAAFRPPPPFCMREYTE